ncbi:MAG TPA: carboxymuconolactone decarboxylase family protein [Micromonosporaceae bacterium]
MAFLHTAAATGDEAERLRAEDEAAWGFVPNFGRTFASRPDVYRAWKQLNGSVRSGMDLGRYELATVAAAAALRSSYCTLAHGRALAADHLPSDTVIALVRDGNSDELTAADRAIVAFAAKVARGAANITVEDIEALHEQGLSDEDILDVTLAAAARCFFSTVLDATGTTPDAVFQGLEPELRSALTVGRPIDEA